MKPILFNTEMVRAILDGRKTMTRRVVKPQPEGAHTILGCDPDKRTFEIMCGNGGEGGIFLDWTEDVKAPFWPGDILYVRETWKNATGDLAGGGYALFDTFVYKADGKAKDNYPLDQLMVEGSWRPSIHMPKEAARIFLRVIDVYPQPLQKMTEDDAIAEGCAPVACPTCLGFGGRCTDCNGTGAIEPAALDFVDTWNSTIKKKELPLYGWEANPWVWVIEFERVERDRENYEQYKD